MKDFCPSAIDIGSKTAIYLQQAQVLWLVPLSSSAQV